jgi:hypothetical protein
VGEEMSNGSNTTITLSTSAAGHGWFLDPTPADNSEFLPTSNPNEWIAKAGNAADGKMDMLSVLLHEYGHALGLDHSPDSHDFMAPTLQPGVRRLMSQADLQQIAHVLGVLGAPAPLPGQPLPPLPYDLALLALAIRQRQSTDSATNGAALGAMAPVVPHYDVVTNPTLTNGDFNGGTGWTTSGNVTVASGSAVLDESATSQTRINQVFTVNANDRFLRFTVSGINLQNPGNGPQDAFERENQAQPPLAQGLGDVCSGQGRATLPKPATADDATGCRMDARTGVCRQDTPVDTPNHPHFTKTLKDRRKTSSPQRLRGLVALAPDRLPVLADGFREARTLAIDDDAGRALLVAVQIIAGLDPELFLSFARFAYGQGRLVLASLVGDLAVVAGQILTSLLQVGRYLVVALPRLRLCLLRFHLRGSCGFLDDFIGVARGEVPRNAVPHQQRHDQAGYAATYFPRQRYGHRLLVSSCEFARPTREDSADQRPKMISLPS